MDILVGEDGLLDVSKLEEAEYQEKFADSLDAYYKNAAKQFFQSGTEDPLKLALMGSTYAGMNREGLLQLIKKETTQLFDKNSYINTIPELTKGIEEILLSDAISHIKEEDIDPILEYTHTADIVNREKVDRIGAIKILNIYEDNGAVPQKWIKRYLKEGEAVEE